MVDVFQATSAIAFWLFFLAALLIIGLSGGATGRQTAVALIMAVVTTFVANECFGMHGAQPIVLMIDVGLLIYVVTLALRSALYWPLWFAGFHTITVASGLAKLSFPKGLPQTYIDLSGFWALPALGAAVVGVLLDRRAASLNSSWPGGGVDKR